MEKTSVYYLNYNHYKCSKVVQRTMIAYRNLPWSYGKRAMMLRLSHEALVGISEKQEEKRGWEICQQEGSKGSLSLSSHFSYVL